MKKDQRVQRQAQSLLGITLRLNDARRLRRSAEHLFRLSSRRYRGEIALGTDGQYYELSGRCLGTPQKQSLEIIARVCKRYDLTFEVEKSRFVKLHSGDRRMQVC